MPLTYILSQKGKKKLIVKNCEFVLDRKIDVTSYWKCTQNTKFKCKARIHTKNDEILKTVGEHNHAADKAGLIVNITLNHMKNEANKSAITPSQLISKSSVAIHDSVAAKLPAVRLLRKMINRKRKSTTVHQQHPKKRCDIIIPEEYKISLKNENFLFYDSGTVKDRILIFATDANITKLENSKHLYADSTFSSSPLIFHQILTIHELVGNYVVPLVYCLLPDKKESTYITVLEQINKNKRMNPESIMTDFEMAEINAFKKGRFKLYIKFSYMFNI